MRVVTGGHLPRTGYPTPGRRLPRFGIAALGVGLAVLTLAAGCGNGSKKATLPPTSGSTGGASPSTSASASLSADQAIRQIYTAFLAASDKAKTAPAEQIRQILAQYVKAGPYLDFLVRDSLQVQEQGRIPWGTVFPHITKIDLTGTSATIHDCSDDSKSGLADKKTGKVVPGTVGGVYDTTVAKLEQGGDGRWLITEVRSYTARCSR